MPELPEVETIKNTLEQFVVNKTITNVNVFWPKIIKLPDDVEAFKQILTGETIQNVNRKGKFLLFEMQDKVLVSHLRMEGKYSVVSPDEQLSKHTHVIFTFNDGKELRYKDIRKFGTMHIFQIGDECNHKPLNQLGPEPFENAFTTDYLYEKLKKTERLIKTVLLDQTVVAGLGNIYVDEILFKAHIHPKRKADTLSKKEIKVLHDAAINILQDAIEKGGTTIRSYVNSDGDMGMFQQELFVYGREGESCRECGEPIIKTAVGGRGTHVCPACQK